MKTNRAKTVCAICYSTGTELIKIGRYTYARPCKHDRPKPLLALAEQKQTETISRDLVWEIPK